MQQVQLKPRSLCAPNSGVCVVWLPTCCRLPPLPCCRTRVPPGPLQSCPLAQVLPGCRPPPLLRNAPAPAQHVGGALHGGGAAAGLAAACAALRPPVLLPAAAWCPSCVLGSRGPPSCGPCPCCPATHTRAKTRLQTVPVTRVLRRPCRARSRRRCPAAALLPLFRLPAPLTPAASEASSPQPWLPACWVSQGPC